MALTPYRARLPGSWRSQTLKGKCRALWTATVILCLLPLLTADESLQNPYSSTRLPRGAAALTWAISNQRWSYPTRQCLSFPAPSLASAASVATCHLCYALNSLAMFRVPSTYPQHQVPGDASWLGVICCIPHSRGPRRCPRYLDIGLFQVCDDIVWAP